MLVNHPSFTEEVRVEDSSGIDLALKQRRILIIFDNLLEVKYLDWDEFCLAVKDVGEVKFLVTTRDSRVSKLIGRIPYHLRSLSDELCKLVIMDKASSHNREIIVRPNFSQVVDALASKCAGLPLVARMIGLVLAKQDEDEWNDLFNEDLWEWKVFKEEIFPLLNSSYEDMLSEVRNCFAFLSLFPNNHHFTLDDIVHLWVGAGFIHQTSHFEQIGRIRLNYLLGKSNIQLCEDINQIERGRFALHKFNQKFAQLAAAKTCIRLDEDIAELPDTIDSLKHLRYLDISTTPIKDFPETLSKVYSLQILKFSSTLSLSCLPKDMHSLINLLYVDWDMESIERLGLPCNIGNLSSLRNLPLYPVGKEGTQCITELQNLNSLRGSIILKNLDNVWDGKKAKIAMLCMKSALTKLELQWNSTRGDVAARGILDNLKPPIRLRELKITRYGFYVFPKWISHPFPFLEKIHLMKCHACSVFPGLGELPTLKVLILEEMSSLETIDTSMHVTPNNDVFTEHFQSLEVFELNNMAALQVWRGVKTSSMLKLRELKFTKCPVLVDIPSVDNFTSLEDIQIECCPSLKALSALPSSVKLVIK